jgi:hypothetical protein
MTLTAREARLKKVRSFMIAALACSASVLAWSCVGDGIDTSSVGTQGKEGEPCYDNGTCNEGLSCLSSLCVNPAADGGTSGVDGASAADAGADAPPTGTDGAPADAGSADAGADATHWCTLNAPDATLCEDFDTLRKLTDFGTPYTQNVDAASLSLTQEKPSSAPNALYGAVPGNDAGASQIAAIYRDLGFTPVSSIDVEADLRCAATTSSVQTMGIVLFFQDLGSKEAHQVGMGVVTQLLIAELNVDDAGGFHPGGAVSSNTPCNPANFLHVGVKITKGTPYQAVLTVNGTPTQAVNLDPSFHFLRASLQLGVELNTDSAPITAVIDNVVIVAD